MNYRTYRVGQTYQREHLLGKEVFGVGKNVQYVVSSEGKIYTTFFHETRKGLVLKRIFNHRTGEDEKESTFEAKGLERIAR